MARQGGTFNPQLAAPRPSCSMSITRPFYTVLELVCAPKGRVRALAQLPTRLRGTARVTFLIKPNCCRGRYSVTSNRDARRDRRPWCKCVGRATVGVKEAPKESGMYHQPIYLTMQRRC